ncbi:MAG: lytic transglycosylase domain-containing protein [Deltaproteobacteria bacterium]|jgi:soluble lytic murein transglycosylase|nr:lytic transglycosylase domain-containing protein [Deltaproteobacteria bacterium]
MRPSISFKLSIYFIAVVVTILLLTAPFELYAGPFDFSPDQTSEAESTTAIAPKSSEKAPEPNETMGKGPPTQEKKTELPWWESNYLGPQRPYWLPAPGQLPPKATDSAPTGQTPLVPKKEPNGVTIFAPPPSPPVDPPAAKASGAKSAETEEKKIAVQEDTSELSYYMFKDGRGVIHLTDAPADPRYRLFTIQITVSTGRAPYRRLNLDGVKAYILKASQTYKIDPALIAAIIKAESNFDPKAVSWAGARGLMQLMPKTAKLVGCLDSFNPEQNIMGGTRYLRMMLNRFKGDVKLSVAAYNAGPERVAKVMDVPAITETRNYVKAVLHNYELFISIFREMNDN